jgi:hypothetical protein
LEPLKFSRSNFCLIAHNQNCYAIGGTCKGRTIRQIEEYDIKKKNWKIVSEIPNDCIYRKIYQKTNTRMADVPRHIECSNT